MMTQFDIRENTYGEHEVIELIPEVLGTFPDRAHADLFYDALLSGRAAVSLAPSGKPGDFGVKAAEGAAPKQHEAPELPSVAASEIVEHSSEALAPQKPTDASDNWKPASDDPVWVTALDRIAAGERVADVAVDLKLPFGSLRARWGAGVKSGKYLAKTPQIARPEPDQPELDAPVSGGVGRALARGKRIQPFTPLQDEEILASSPSGLARLAKSFGKSVDMVRRRSEALEARAQALMAPGDRIADGAEE